MSLVGCRHWLGALMSRGAVPLLFLVLILLAISKSSHDVSRLPTFLVVSFVVTILACCVDHLQNSQSPSEHYLRRGPFHPMPIPGFINTGRPGGRSCDGLRFNHTVGVQKSIILEDNLVDIATTLNNHPVIEYPKDRLKDPKVRVIDLIGDTWARLSGSSVWLPDQGVFFSVTRAIYTPIGSPFIKMSFLRGQLFDRNWNELVNHTLTWGEVQITFPLVFDVPAPWEAGKSYFGPEDPRVILEENVDGAEPVVIFNMISPATEWKRAMYTFRPFTNHTTLLTINDTPRKDKEKNWAPFFISENQQGNLNSRGSRKPSEYIHFLYSFDPLSVLKCHLRCGHCEFVFDQRTSDKAEISTKDNGGSLRGGTNFVPVPRSQHWDTNIGVHVAFSRTNVRGYCPYQSFYRPEMTVLINVGTHFHLAFTSESLDFGDALIDLKPQDNRCDKGRILIPNSITQWDVHDDQDMMTVSFSVDDKSVQVSRIHGILRLIRHLPPIENLRKKSAMIRENDVDVRNFALSLGGSEIRACLVEAALNYTAAALQINHLAHHTDPDTAHHKLAGKIAKLEAELDESQSFNI